MKTIVERIFSNIFQLYFASFSFNQHSKCRNYLEKIGYSLNFFPLIIIHLLTMWRTALATDSWEPYANYIAQAILVLAHSIFIGLYGLRQKPLFHKLLLKVNKIFMQLKIEISIKFYRYFVNCFYIFTILTVLSHIQAKDTPYKIEWNNFYSKWIDHAIVATHVLVNWYYFFWSMAAFMMYFVIMCIQAKEFKILSQDSFETKINPKIYLTYAMVFHTTQKVIETFGLISLSNTYMLFVNTIITIWPFFRSDTIKFATILSLHYGAIVVIAMLEVGIYVDSIVSIRLLLKIWPSAPSNDDFCFILVISKTL